MVAGRRARLEPDVALDGLVDDNYRLAAARQKKDVTATTLDASVNWDNPNAYGSPGAPSNGADYVRLRNTVGATWPARHRLDLVQRVEGASARPVQWTVDTNPPRLRETQRSSPASTICGTRRSSARSRFRPARARLTFDAFWNEELGWDFGFAQISDDGGSTYTSLRAPTRHRPMTRTRCRPRSRMFPDSPATRRRSCRRRAA